MASFTARVASQPGNTPPSGPHDASAFDLLTADHRLVRDLFEHVDAVSQARLAADRHRKPDLMRQVLDELGVHMQLEESVFYPQLRAALRESEDVLVEHAEHEHAEARQLIDQLRALLGPLRPTAPAGADGETDAQVDALFAQLRTVIEHHVRDEEERLFPAAAPRVDAAALGRQLQQQKRAILEQMGQIC